jgi:glyoxylase-like metal-dependent hydrolase (beta-lactamase superfamily II)
MRSAVPAARSIDTLVNTHSDPDHTFGNQLVAGAQIIATRRAAAEMGASQAPAALREMVAAAPRMGAAGAFIEDAFCAFDFSGVELVAPTRAFEGELELTVGALAVSLIEVGPAHTAGDLLVHVPAQRVVFTGDILFAGVHPVMWAGSASNWIAACDRVLAMDVDIVVPGHGPVTDKASVRAMRTYLADVWKEASCGCRDGVPPREMARRIDLSAYAAWTGPERILATVDAIYREIAGDPSPADQAALFAEMGAMKASSPPCC